MRQVSFCLVGFALLFLTLPLGAQPAPLASSPLEAVTSCPADTGPAPLEGAADLSFLEEIAGPAPTPMACEPNFCNLSRGYCETSCAPCSFNFSCKGRTCESICTCTC